MTNSPLQIWLMAARPKTLPAGLTPVIIGAAMARADSRFHLLSVLAAMVASILIQVGTNFANDYFDFVKGTDTEERVGPARATQQGLVAPWVMLLATILVFALACLPGYYLILRGGIPIIVIGILSIFCGVLYTGGPYPLGYLGLGDVFVLIFFGPVAVGGTYYVQAQSWDSLALIAGLAPGLISMAILTVNNLRDADTDVKTGKKTLAVRFGKTFARLEYAVTMFAGMVLVPLYLCYMSEGHYGALVACLVFIPGLMAIYKVFTLDGADLNVMLAQTGKLLLIFSILFSVGWLL